MIGSTRTIVNTAASLIVACLLSAPAYAAPHATEYFGRVTTPAPAQSKVAAAQAAAQAAKAAREVPVKWFEAFDDKIASHRPSAADHVILGRQFKQEAERVQQWIETASRVARNYRELAKQLRAMPVPNTLQGVKDYRDLTADWYDDAAAIYEDLIRPRQRCQTMEDLEESVNRIKERAQSLHQTNLNLKAMDLSLRKTYKVHLARHEDALQQYVRSR
ncbi:MAG TPA: hypothetical protein V6D08_18640 [Candidatus Obscuribacterales bacterium]